MIVGRGSRRPEGNEPLLELCRTLERRFEITPVQPSYLELARPTIGEGLATLNRRGVLRVIVVPLQLLFSGRLPDRIQVQVAEVSR